MWRWGQHQSKDVTIYMVRRAALTIALGCHAGGCATQDQPAQTQQQQSFTDAQISAFAAASVEADPISRSLANATPEQ